MTEEQRDSLIASLRGIHESVHNLYPRGESAAEPAAQALRNKLLVIDLIVHLAEEVIHTASLDIEQVAQRTANLLYALHLVAPQHKLEQAAELLLTAGQSETD